MNNAYFKNVADIGDIYLEKVFSEFEGENTIFVCKDLIGRRYLCICYEMRYSLEWILIDVSSNILLDLILKK